MPIYYEIFNTHFSLTHFSVFLSPFQSQKGAKEYADLNIPRSQRSRRKRRKPRPSSSSGPTPSGSCDEGKVDSDHETTSSSGTYTNNIVNKTCKSSILSKPRPRLTVTGQRQLIQTKIIQMKHTDIPFSCQKLLCNKISWKCTQEIILETDCLSV